MSLPIFIQKGETLEQALERADKQQDKINYEQWKPKLIDEKFIWLDGFVTVIIDGLDDNPKIYKKCIVAEEQKEASSFRDILKFFNLDLKKIGKYTTIYIWIDDYLNGDIWKMSRVDGEKEFYHYGRTQGFA